MINITDIPIKKDDEDQLGIEDYKNALLNYIQNSETPMTISIQGEWGSGKTSLMNMLKYRLDEDKTPMIWINTWEYSMVGEDFAAISIFQTIVSHMLSFLGENSENLKDKIKANVSTITSIVGTVSKGVGKLALSTTMGVNSNSAVDDLSKTFSNSSSIGKLKKELKTLAEDILSKEKFKKSNKIIFFIDDLDRLNPEVAIKVLEVLKNVFDLEKCLFVLAIDYEVIVKGLSVKFGDQQVSEREYRQFFDKIIQLPFSLPVSQYKSENYIRDLIANNKIKYFTPKEFEDNSKYLMSIINYSVGGNPRALKRMANYLSLVSSIMKKSDIDEKLIHFTLIALQIVYPFVYEMLVNEPDFRSWNSSIFKTVDLKLPVEMEDKEEFDEEWEKELLKAIQNTKNQYFRERSFDISNLLNLVANQFNANDQYVELIDNALSTASLTSVSRKSDSCKEPTNISSVWEKLSSQIDGIRIIKSRSQLINPKESFWKMRLSINQNSSRVGILFKMNKGAKWSKIKEDAEKLENIGISDDTKEKNIYYSIAGGSDNFDTVFDELVEKYNILSNFTEDNL